MRLRPWTVAEEVIDGLGRPGSGQFGRTHRPTATCMRSPGPKGVAVAPSTSKPRAS
jgi:hypothetical protein